MAIPQFHPHDVNAFQPTARRVIICAGVLGWTIRWANQRKGMAVLISEDGSKKINVPKTSLNSHRSDAMIRQIVTHTKPEAITELFKGADLTKDTDMADLLVWLARYLPTPTETETPAVPIHNEPLPFDTETPEPPKTDSPLVISTQPVVTARGKVSTRVIQRQWSDKHVDYVCAECDFSALTENPVRSHNVFKHHRDTFRRTPHEGAKANAQPTLEVFPGDPTQGVRDAVGIVEAMKRLLWSGVIDEVHELHATVDALEAALAEANARADAAEGDLKALRDLLGKY